MLDVPSMEGLGGSARGQPTFRLNDDLMIELGPCFFTVLSIEADSFGVFAEVVSRPVEADKVLDSMGISKELLGRGTEVVVPIYVGDELFKRLEWICSAGLNYAEVMLNQLPDGLLFVGQR